MNSIQEVNKMRISTYIFNSPLTRASWKYNLIHCYQRNGTGHYIRYRIIYKDATYESPLAVRDNPPRLNGNQEPESTYRMKPKTKRITARKRKERRIQLNTLHALNMKGTRPRHVQAKLLNFHRRLEPLH